jgi:hypothetical protein
MPKENISRLITNDFENLYFITSANWEVSVVASNHEEAASKALELMLDNEGANLKLSPAIISLNCSKFCINFNQDHSKILSTPYILSNIGRHDLSKKFKKIIPS